MIFQNLGVPWHTRHTQGRQAYIYFKGNLKKKFSWNSIAKKAIEIFWRIPALASKLGEEGIFYREIGQKKHASSNFRSNLKRIWKL
jgi:hypothetical protein